MKKVLEQIPVSLIGYGMIVLLIYLSFWGNGKQEQVLAATYQDYTGNAENFYDTYGDKKMVFFPIDKVDGKIYR